MEEIMKLIIIIIFASFAFASFASTIEKDLDKICKIFSEVKSGKKFDPEKYYTQKRNTIIAQVNKQIKSHKIKKLFAQTLYLGHYERRQKWGELFNLYEKESCSEIFYPLVDKIHHKHYFQRLCEIHFEVYNDMSINKYLKATIISTRIEKEILSEGILRTTHALAVASPDQKWKLYQKSAKAMGVTDWQCPIMEKIFKK